jgi:hypothetical protein
MVIVAKRKTQFQIVRSESCIRTHDPEPLDRFYGNKSSLITVLLKEFFLLDSCA